MKTLGQIAFEAYSESVGGKTYDDKPIPQWGELRPTIQAGWEAAGAAASAGPSVNSDESIAVDYEAWNALLTAYRVLKACKPDDRSERARRYAVTITELEKAISYFKTMVAEDWHDHQL